MPDVLIIAGPNGAGKTTFALKFLAAQAPEYQFLNADNIAAEPCPEAPESVAVEAGRRMLEQVDECVTHSLSFCIETTLSGRAWIRRIRRWQEEGYRVTLIFLALESAKLARKRVANRVRMGGHQIPSDVIDRRYDAGLQNFHEVYKVIVDDWYLYENSKRTTFLSSKDHEDHSEDD